MVMQTKQQIEQAMINSMLRVIDAYFQRGYINSPQIISLVKILFVPQMTYILKKYSERDFHRLMRQVYIDERGQKIMGFDFIGDWRKHHALAFTIALTIGRNFRNQLDYNVDVMANLMVDVMRSWGWNVQPHEKASLRHDLIRIKRILGYNI